MNPDTHKHPCGDGRPRLSVRAKLEGSLSPSMKFDLSIRLARDLVL